MMRNDMRGRWGKQKLNLARAVGMMGEIIACIELRRRGFRIDLERRKCRLVCGEKDSEEDRLHKRQLLRERISNRKPWCECLFGMRECPYGKRWYELIQEGRYTRDKVKRSTFWDFYAQRDGKEFLIEIKTTTRDYYRPYFPDTGLTRSQRHILEYARDAGYNTLIVRGRLDLSMRGSLIDLSNGEVLTEFSSHY